MRTVGLHDVWTFRCHVRRVVGCYRVIGAETHRNGFMPAVERNLYHVNVNHQIGFEDCLVRLNDFIFFCVSHVGNLVGILRIEVSELMRIELVHNVFSEHIGEFVFLHLAVQCDGTHQLDVLFLHAVVIEHLQKRLYHNLPHIRLFGGGKGLAIIIKQDKYL